MNIDITKQMEMVLYRTEDDNVTVSALIKDETIWLTQKAMAELFGIDKSGISRHLAKIFESGELDEGVVVAKIATTTQHGAMQDKTQTIQATRFRIWATGILKEYMIKGFAMDDERLKQGKTAAEIVYNQADHTKENMGLTTWENAPDVRILKSDTPIAKNYLDEKQIRQLERAVTGYFDYIEDLIERENVFTMEEFSKSVNEFLAFRRYDILKDNGRISHKQAVEKAYQEYDIFNKTQPIESDFDKIVKGLEKKE